jgi:uncharacterized membrane-anchored protein YhcB (DUF1043 family)
MAFNMIVLAGALLVGVLIGATLCERLLEARTRRQASRQRALNSQWQELAMQWREIEIALDEIDLQRQQRSEGAPQEPAWH